MVDGRPGFEIYIHFPFCRKKCDYCDFLSGPAPSQERETYVKALVREIRSTGIRGDRTVSSVFIGGGTPSLLTEDQLERIMEALRGTFRIEADAEISIEANPGTASGDFFSCCVKNGINRLSLGLQSADDAQLRMLGRIHSFRDFVKSYEDARAAGFSNINVDLMFAIPGQSLAEWERTLHQTASFSPEHISAYSLIIEEGTPFSRRTLSLPDEDTEYRMYDETASILGGYGYRQYEISNYAKPGKECRHNQGYWKRLDYLGFGPGAASLWEGERYRITRDMDTYLRCCEDRALLKRDAEKLSPEDVMAETMFLGLRMTEGVTEEDFLAASGKHLEEVYGDVIAGYTRLGLLDFHEGRLRLTRRGIHVSNTVMADFLL